MCYTWVRIEVVMKKLSIMLISLFGFFFCCNIVNANSIKSIDMDIYIDEFGNATIKEIWDANLVSGTEGYRSYTDLGNSTISDFIMYDDKGINYVYQNNWDTSLSFDEKAYKNAINYNYNGVELCWGISEYGDRKYYLNYKINNFVSQFTDKQGIYFNLLDLDQSVGNVKIKISSYIPLNLENSKIWGFGYDGNIVFQDNSIIMDSGFLNSSEYMVLLVRFENDLFNTTNVVNKTFDDVYEEAFSDDKLMDDINNQFFEFIYLILMIFSFPIIVLMFMSRRTKVKYKEKYEGGKILKCINVVDYYREIPCDKDLFNIYYLMLIYFKEDKKKLQKRLVSSLIMKWILENRIEYIDRKIFIKNNPHNSYKTDYQFKNINQEEELFWMISEASGGDSYLEKNEFKKWCKRNYNKLIYWFNSVENLGKNYYYIRKHIEYSNIEKKLFIKRKTYYTIYKSSLKEEAYKLLGFKRFLLDFGRMKEKSTVEVELWNYYLIIANMLGISDKVINELKVFYPELNIDVDYLEEIINDGYRTMERTKKQHDREEARRNRDYSGRDRYSGGGGRSFSSGGSSARGSSGGGFR